MNLDAITVKEGIKQLYRMQISTPGIYEGIWYLARLQGEVMAYRCKVTIFNRAAKLGLDPINVDVCTYGAK